MSEPENKQLIEQTYAAFGRGDLPFMWTGCTPGRCERAKSWDSANTPTPPLSWRPCAEAELLPESKIQNLKSADD